MVDIGPWALRYNGSTVYFFSMEFIENEIQQNRHDIVPLHIMLIFNCSSNTNSGVSLSIATVAKCDKFAKVASKFQKWRIWMATTYFRCQVSDRLEKVLFLCIIHSNFWSFVLWCKDTGEPPETDTSQLSFSPIGDFTAWNSHLDANIPLCPPINALLIARFKEFGFV